MGWRKGSSHGSTARLQHECSSHQVTLSCLSCQWHAESRHRVEPASHLVTLWWPGAGLPRPGGRASRHPASRTATAPGMRHSAVRCVRRGSHAGGTCRPGAPRQCHRDAPPSPARRPVPLSGSSPLGRRPLQHLPVAAAPECQSESPSQWHGAGGAGRTPGSQAAGRPGRGLSALCPGPHRQAPPLAVGPH